MPTYRAIQLKGKGGLDQLQEIELPLVAPKKGEIRIRVGASGVGFTDIMKRTGYYPYRPAFPYVEGYEVVGDVDAIGEGVAGFALGQRVCALTVYGAWAEYFTRDAEDFVPVPEGLDDAEIDTLRGFVSLFLGARSVGRRGTFYGITALYRKDKRPFKEDLPKLFELLAARRIQPRIAARLPLLAGRDAERLLEAGGIGGKVVLLRSSDE
jgi:NADPH:quinone reductase-like Zn-dependent oxidoreductase